MKYQSYAAAGVDIAAATRIKETIARLAPATFSPQVLKGIGLFGSLFELTGYREPVLVASADGVGTKLKIATALSQYDTVGVDLVHHCVNDILTLGAQPLFFLDYIAMERLNAEAVAGIVAGMVRACRETGCALIGGETAEMPGVYREGELDLVGFIVGVAEKDSLIDGSTIVQGDQVLALPSSGLHTNGYSLVRRIFDLDRDPSPLRKFYPEIGKTLGEALLEPHRCYLAQLKPWLGGVKGLAHITGGGIAGNLSRILPPHLSARIAKERWAIPPLFHLIQRQGPVAEAEMFRVFNMGVGMAVVLAPEAVAEFRASLPLACSIGEIEQRGAGEPVIIQ